MNIRKVTPARSFSETCPPSIKIGMALSVLQRHILGAPVGAGSVPSGLQALGIGEPARVAMRHELTMTAGSAVCLITVITSANSQAVLLALPSPASLPGSETWN